MLCAVIKYVCEDQMACGPTCFKCRLEMPSGLVDLVFLAALIAAMVVCGVNCVGRAVSGVSL